MKLLLLIPALAFLLLLLINLSVFSASTDINFFWLASFQLPVAVFISLFFICYIALIWIGFNLKGSFSDMKSKKLEKEVFDLKAKLLSKQWDLIQNIENKFDTKINDLKTEADKKLELYKKENEKVVTNMQYDFKTIGDKIDKLAKIK